MRSLSVVFMTSLSTQLSKRSIQLAAEKGGIKGVIQDEWLQIAVDKIIKNAGVERNWKNKTNMY
jgi:hypothetical protein